MILQLSQNIFSNRFAAYLELLEEHWQFPLLSFPWTLRQHRLLIASLALCSLVVELCPLAHLQLLWTKLGFSHNPGMFHIYHQCNLWSKNNHLFSKIICFMTGLKAKSITPSCLSKSVTVISSSFFEIWSWNSWSSMCLIFNFDIKMWPEFSILRECTLIIKQKIMHFLKNQRAQIWKCNTHNR